MNSSSSVSVPWSIAVIIVIPLLIVVITELDERLRQRESRMRPAVTLLRVWGLPFMALWALLVPMFSLDSDDLAVRAAATGVVLVVGIASMSVLRVFIDGIRDADRKREGRGTPQLLLALPRISLILITGWILIAGVWQVDLSAALTALGVTSLIISFALQDTLSGLAAGILLLSDQPFKTGDWITTGDTVGRVTDINWRTTRIETRDGSLVIVPNSELAGTIVTNHSAPHPLHRVSVEVSVAFVNPPTLAKDMLLDAALATPGVLLDPPPVVKVIMVDDPLMGYEAQMWIEDFKTAPQVESDFGALVWYQSHRHNVPLPSPAQDLFLHDAATAGADPRATTSELRRRLLKSPLFSSLPDADLDLLVAAATPERFAAGERIVDAGQEDRDLLVLVEGTARLVLAESDRVVTVDELSAGQLLGLVLPAGFSGDVFISAVSDCEVLRVSAEAAAVTISSNTDVSAAFNQVLETRVKRIERLATTRSSLPETEL
ncbi:MAG: mechanosensitive ion channel [Acidobacteria bacterium]|nr:mechanosensitive ion channel [Acidobacteriota bacterium]